MQEWRKPYRILVFAHGFRPGKRRKTFTEIVPSQYGYMGWTPLQTYDKGARLPNAGSFLYPGIVAVRKAAMVYLAIPSTHQVQIRTNQDRKVYLWNKHPDGSITGYANGD